MSDPENGNPKQSPQLASLSSVSGDYRPNPTAHSDPTTPSGSVTRLQAIARLKRAASNREVRSDKVALHTDTTEENVQLLPQDAEMVTFRRVPEVVIHAGSPTVPLDPSLDSSLPSTQVQHSMAAAEISPPSPRQDPNSVQISENSLPTHHMPLSRSASASRAENRSLLPTLEQLRSRILHERLTAGLQRSVSASAASAAARAYAMNKLLGEASGARHGATSPVSDSAHGRLGTIEDDDDEDDDDDDDENCLRPQHGNEEQIQSDDEGSRVSQRVSKRSRNQYLRPPSLRNSSHYRSLRRSRTISGMSQRAEDERKTAFQRDLDLFEEQPDADGDIGLRRRKRMSRLPTRQISGASSRNPDRAIGIVVHPQQPKSAGHLSTSLRADESPMIHCISIDAMKASENLRRKTSQREAARTQMMRKLSGRRLGGPSPVPPTDPAGTPEVLSSVGHREASNVKDEDRDSNAHFLPTPSLKAQPIGGKGFDPVYIRTPAQQPFLHNKSLLRTPILDPNVGDMSLTPEQQIAFLQMQHLLREQQLQLNRGVAEFDMLGMSLTAGGDGSEGDDDDVVGHTATNLSFDSPTHVRPQEDGTDASIDEIDDVKRAGCMNTLGLVQQEDYAKSSLQNSSSPCAGILVVPQTPVIAPTKPAKSQDSTLLVTPGGTLSSPQSSSNQSRTLSRTETVWGSSGATSIVNTSNNLIPFIQFPSQGPGNAAAITAERALPDWPTSPSSSSAGFEESEYGDLISGENPRSSLSSQEAIAGAVATSRGQSLDHSRWRTSGSLSSEVPLSVAVAPSPSTSRPAFLTPIAARQTPGSATSASTCSTYSPNPDRSMSRISRATSVGIDGDHFVYEGLLAGHSTSTLGMFGGISPGQTPQSSRISGQLQRQQSENCVAVYSDPVMPARISLAKSPQDSFEPSSNVSEWQSLELPGQNGHGPTGRKSNSQHSTEQQVPSTNPDVDAADRFGTWRHWMKAQGMDVSDLDSPLKGRASPPASAKFSEASLKVPERGLHKVELPSLDPSSLHNGQKHDLVIDVSPSLVREFGADIDWPERLDLTDNREKAKHSTSLSRHGSLDHTEHNVAARDVNTATHAHVANSVNDPPRLDEGQPKSNTAAALDISVNSVQVGQQPMLNSASNDLQHFLKQRVDDPLAARPREQPYSKEMTVEKERKGRNTADAKSQSPVQRLASANPPADQSQSNNVAARALYPLRDRVKQGEVNEGPPPSAWAGTASNELTSALDSPQPASNAGSLAASNAPSKLLFSTQHHRGAYANEKLTPFPGLFQKAPGGPFAPLLSTFPDIGASIAPDSSRSVASPVPSILAKHKVTNSVSSTAQADLSANAVSDGAGSGRGGSKSLFGSLRRKASAAMRSGSLRRKGSNVTPYNVNVSCSRPATSNSVRPAEALYSAAEGTANTQSPLNAPTAARSVSGLQRELFSGQTLRSRTMLGQASTASAAAPKSSASDVQLEKASLAPSHPHRGASQPHDDRRRAVIVPEFAAATDHAISLPTGYSQEPMLRTHNHFAGRQHGSHHACSPEGQMTIFTHSRSSSIASLSSSHLHRAAVASGGAANVSGFGDETLDAGRSVPAISAVTVPDANELELKSAALLHRYSRILTSSTKANPTSPGVPGLTVQDVESPPRQLLKVSPAYQIASASTIKDRFLFLFNDILVIAKPCAPPTSYSMDKTPDITWTFEVKRIIELRHLTLTVIKDSRHRRINNDHPLRAIFAEAFSHDAEEALADIIHRSGLPSNTQTKAQLLAQTPGLDKEVLTRFVCEPSRRGILSAFVKLQRVIGVSIESALRSVLLSLRFPAEPLAFEALLMEFATHWVVENRDLIKKEFSEQLAADLTFAIMALNDALHGCDTSGGALTGAAAQREYRAPGIFSEPVQNLSKSTFLQAFRVHDSALVLSDQTLLRIYSSVKLDPVQQGLDKEEQEDMRVIRVEGAGFPAKLVFGVPSERIIISIPEKDSEFSLRLYGQDLQFDPPVLSFALTNSQSFTITSRALGVRHAVFVRAGRRARYYCGSVNGPEATEELRMAASQQSVSDLPRSVAFTVERAFMQHSFSLIASPSSSDTSASRRKFLFSVNDASSKQAWTDLLQRSIQASSKARGELQKQIAQGGSASDRVQAHKAALALSLHVLRQALIQSDRLAANFAESKDAAPSLHRSASGIIDKSSGVASSRLASHARAPSDSRLIGASVHRSEWSNASSLGRNASVSHRYYAPESGVGKEERAFLSPLDEKAGRNPLALHRTTDVIAEEHQTEGSVGQSARSEARVLIGDDLITVCVQNSLLPLVLERSAGEDSGL